MIDNLALFLFGLLILYTVFRAIKLDRLIPWFSASEPPQQPTGKQRN
jgi:hypothetical protein